jgi:phosphoglycolate phosphatase
VANVIFDLDGTLVDSREAIIASLRHVQRQCGLECSTADSLQWALGPPLSDIMRRLLNSSDDAQIARAVAIYREHHPSVCVNQAALYPGIHDAVRGLADMGHQLFVATSKLWDGG